MFYTFQLKTMLKEMHKLFRKDSIFSLLLQKKTFSGIGFVLFVKYFKVSRLQNILNHKQKLLQNILFMDFKDNFTFYDFPTVEKL